MNEINSNAWKEAVWRALVEDCAASDITTRWSVPEGACAGAHILARQDGLVAGMPILTEIYRQLDDAVEVTALVADGDRVRDGQRIADVSGPARSVITGERTALNFLQRMSGIATHTAAYVDAVAGLPVRILDTRKTAPGLRVLDKYAVTTGGGGNHRLHLSAMVLLKENHIAAAGGVSAAVAAVRAHNTTGVAVEVEVESVEQAVEALHEDVEWIMLDNMSAADMRQVVAERAERTIKLEASGNVSLENVREIAEVGIDAISVGAITHSAPALDLSLLLERG
jgi:nicotinate-nucleotide pyrophosphorylase (carboxylating)